MTPTRGGRDIESADEGGFIGRRRELGLLMSGLESAVTGRGRLFMLTGEPGIGKTRIAAEFAVHARADGARVMWGRCWEGAGAPPYWPWVQAIRSLLRDHAPESLSQLMGSGVSDIAQMLPEIHALYPDLPPLQSSDPESARFQLFDSTATFLGRASSSQPIVLVLDDIHSADIPSLLLLRFVAGQITDTRIVLVATYRHGELTAEHPLTELASDIAREPATQEVRLLGLGETEIAAFVESATQTSPDPGLVSRLSRETTGNPLYLEQAVRLHATEMRLGVFAEADLLDLNVPARISDLILRRVDHVSSMCGEALRLASVLGSEFSFETLRRLGRFSQEEIVEVIDEATEAGLVLRAADHSPLVTFSHDLIRQSLYESLSQPERVRWHAEAAKALESSYGEDTEPHLAELAHHFFEAAPGGYADRAVEYARRAGHSAAVSLAYEEAARLHTMALAALETLPSFDEQLRIEILLDIGEAQTRAAEDARAKETFSRAARLGKRIAAAQQLARAALGYGGIFVWQRAGADRQVVPLLQDALVMLGGADDHLRVRLLARLACALRDSPDRETSDTLSAEAVRIARQLGEPATLCYALEGRIAAIMWPENPEDRLTLARELKDIATRYEQFERLVGGRVFEISALCDLGLIAEARSGIENLALEAERLRQPNQMFIALINHTAVELLEGHLLRAEEEVRSAMDKGFSGRDEYSSTRFHTFLLRREQGRLAEIEDFVRDSVRNFPWYPVHRVALVCLLAGIGKTQEAHQLFDELAQEDFRMLNRDCEWLLGMSLASEASLVLGEVEAASSLYGQLLPFAGRHAYGWAEGSVGTVDRYLGLLSYTLGRHDEGVAHLEAAIEGNKRMGARPWTAHCQHDLGRVLMARDGPGDRERALELLGEAKDTAQRLEMTALFDELSSIDSKDASARHGRAGSVRRGVFRREGEYWSISFSNGSFRLRHVKGLGYLAQLLATPDKETHVLDMVAVQGGRGPVAEGLPLRGLGDAGDILDREARSSYRRRLRELQDELVEAEAWNDQQRAIQTRTEIEYLTKELSGAEGLGGRPRKAGSAVERARINVTRAIRSAIARLAQHDPKLGRHLDSTVRTGTFCSYNPDPLTPVDWQL